MLLFFVSILVAQEARQLKGELISVGEHEGRMPVTGITITIKETGDSDKSDARGFFKIFLPEKFQAGDKITLLIDKPGWRIHYPLDAISVSPQSLRRILSL